MLQTDTSNRFVLALLAALGAALATSHRPFSAVPAWLIPLGTPTFREATPSPRHHHPDRGRADAGAPVQPRAVAYAGSYTVSRLRNADDPFLPLPA